MLWLNHQDIIKSGVTQMTVAQPLIEDIFRLLGTNNVKMAPEVPLRCRAVTTDEAFYSLSAYIGGTHQVAGIKWTTHHPDNCRKGMPHIYTLITINDPDTGLPLAVMEASLISAMRTGAVTATALKYLTSENAETLFCCGAGFQARQQLYGAVHALPELKRVYIWGRTKTKAEALAEELQSTLPNCLFKAVEDTSLCKTADVVLSITSASEPYLTASDFKDGVLFCHIGFNEITPDGILSFDEFVFDDYAMGIENSGQAVFRLAREGSFSESMITGLLQEVVQGKKHIRAENGKKLFFDAFGLVVFDLVLAQYAYNQAKKMGIGNELSLF
jgi:ornithine cyclodeaminase/alanine dehydrogenase-like protein (mu-crystallin family)